MIRLVLILLALFAHSALAETTAPDWDRCFDANSARERLDACERVTTDAAAPREIRVDAHNLRGVAFRSLGQTELALAEYTAAIELAPDYAMAIYNRARIYRELGQLDLSLQEFDRALALDPSNPRILNETCWIRVIQGRDLQTAARICDAAVRAAPSDPEAIDTRALLRLKTGDFTGALADYDAAIALSPDHLDHYRFGRGIALIRLNRVAEGQAEIAGAIETNPSIASEYADWGVHP